MKKKKQPPYVPMTDAFVAANLEKVRAVLTTDRQHVMTITDRVGLSITDTLGLLMRLEMSKHATRWPGDCYSLRAFFPETADESGK